MVHQIRDEAIEINRFAARTASVMVKGIVQASSRPTANRESAVSVGGGRGGAEAKETTDGIYVFTGDCAGFPTQDHPRGGEIQPRAADSPEFSVPSHIRRIYRPAVPCNAGNPRA